LYLVDHPFPKDKTAVDVEGALHASKLVLGLTP
jgi:hypothetical protein